MSVAATLDRIGAYKVVRCIGAGGMGAVFEAIHEAIERRVAIKILLPECARNPELTARFFNEARAVNRINHPSIIQIHDFGNDSAGAAFIVMELLDGESLAKRLHRLGGRVELSFALQTSWQIAGALAAAHAKEIIHRDLKPDNLMLVPDPVVPGGERVKLLDFGIAKLAAGTPMGRTSSQIIMGTPSYMSPEQCRGAGAVDGKSDVYSLGVLLFQMLAGQLPFYAEGAGELIAKHLYQEPPALAALAPELPDEVSALVHKLLAKDRLLRPTMREVVLELEPLLDSYSSGAPQAGPTLRSSGKLAADGFLGNNSTFSQSSGQRLPSRSVRLLHLAVAVVASVTCTGTGFFFWQRRAERATRSASHSIRVEYPSIGDPPESKTAPAMSRSVADEVPSSKQPPVPEWSAAMIQANRLEPDKELAPANTPNTSKRRRKGHIVAGRAHSQGIVPAKLINAEQLADRGDWDGALYAAQDPAVIDAAPERAWLVIGSAACHMRRTTLAADAYRRVDTTRKNVIRSQCEEQSVRLPGAKSAEAETKTELLLAAQENLFHHRFREAIALALPLTESNPTEAWRIVGQAACSQREAVLATRARQAASAQVQQELDQACDVSGLEMEQGIYHVRTR